MLATPLANSQMPSTSRRNYFTIVLLVVHFKEIQHSQNPTSSRLNFSSLAREAICINVGNRIFHHISHLKKEEKTICCVRWLQKIREHNGAIQITNQYILVWSNQQPREKL